MIYGVVSPEVIDAITAKWNVTRIVQFGSSLYKKLYKDIDLFVETQDGIGKIRDHKFLSMIQSEKWDVTLTPDVDRLMELLSIRKYKVIYEKSLDS